MALPYPIRELTLLLQVRAVAVLYRNWRKQLSLGEGRVAMVFAGFVFRNETINRRIERHKIRLNFRNPNNQHSDYNARRYQECFCVWVVRAKDPP